MANGNGYSAGNLEFAVQEISNKAMSSLDALISKLQTVVSLLGNVSSLTNSLGTTINGTTRGSASSNLSQQKASARVTKNVKDDINQIAKSVKKMSSSSLTDIVNKVYFWHNYTKQIFRTGINIVKNAVEYTETLNLWQVAMRGNREEAEEFVSTMNKAYGVATQTLMQYQAVFRNMLSSLGGINENITYQLSEYLTQMAIDYASLYNTSIEKAMTTFQSVLSGQVRPIRSIAGYDITETTIYQLYQQLGGTKTMRQLSQTEKRLLRIYAVFQQMESSGAIGDLGKTMESTANQWRVFREATKELSTWFGILFEHYIRPLLPYLNAFVITLTNIVKAFVQMNGIKPQEFGIVEGVQELNEELDETQGKLLDFDKFSVLGQGGEEESALGIDSNLLAGLSKYESILSNITGEAQKLAEKWTSWFVDIDTGKLTESGKELLDVLEDIAIVVGVLVGLNLIKKIGSLVFGFKSMAGAIRSIGFAIAVLSISEIIKNWKDWNTLGKTLTGIMLGLTTVMAGLAVTFFALQHQWGKAITVASVIVGAGTTVALGLGNIASFKTGGLVEDGLFQMSRGELVGEFDDGTTVVANNQQIIEGIKQGVYTAVRSAMGSGASGDIVLKVDSKEIARATVGATANALSKNYRVDFQPR